MRVALLLAPLLLAACSGEGDPGPGGVTADEARQLDAAAASIDINAADNVTDNSTEAGQ